MAIANNVDRLRELNQKAEAGGGPERARRQHEQGKLLARERLDILLDSGSFVELDRLRTLGLELLERRLCFLCELLQACGLDYSQPPINIPHDTANETRNRER